VASKSIGLYISGLETEKEAEDERSSALQWFYSTFEHKKYVVTSSVSKGPYGYRMEMNAYEET
jgi:hypothetical protein